MSQSTDHSFHTEMPLAPPTVVEKPIPLAPPTVVEKPMYSNNNSVEPYDFEKRSGAQCCSSMSFPLQATLLASSGSFLFGFNLALLNTSLKAINVEFGWCDDPDANSSCLRQKNYTAFLNTAVFIGAAVGSMTAGRFLALGRRTVFMLSMAIFALGIVSSCVANSFSSLLLARLIVGYGVGLVSFICPMYIAEMSPKEKRGTFGVVHQLMITVGIFVAVLIGLPFSAVPRKDALDYNTWTLPIFDKVWWRVMLGLGILPVIATGYLLSFVYTSETPNYYVENKQYDDAAALLRIINEKTDVAELLAEIEKGNEEAEQAKKDGLSLVKAISRKEYQMVIVVGCLLSAFQQLTGINVFIAQSNQLFEEAGFQGASVTGFSVALTGVNVLMTFPALYLIESLGRKSLLMIGTAGQAVGVVVPAVMYLIKPESKITSYLAIAGAIFFIIFFAIAYGPVLWVYLFEIYPAEIRGAAAGAATAINWVCGIVMVFVTNYIGNRVAYSLFAIMCVIAFLISLLLMKETKGRSLDDSPYMTKTKSVVNP